MDTPIIAPEQFDFSIMNSIKNQTKPVGNHGGRHKSKYKNIITAFDIETSRITTGYRTVQGKREPIQHAFMYVWQWQLGSIATVIGRTWEQFFTFINQLAQRIGEDEKIVVFVHNLSYEFQFLRGLYTFQSEEVFSLKPRKVLKCEMYNKFEFRCSYLHANMSLAEYTSKMQAEHVKLDGDEFDYSEVRYPWTPLTDRQLQYCQHDVLGLVEAITNEMQFDGDNLYTFPLTSTGYVRRDAKHAMREMTHGYVSAMLPNYQIYQMLREAFRGGDTHANRYYANIIIKNVYSADRTSSYPDVQCNCLFPVTEFEYWGKVAFDELVEIVNVRHKAVIMRISITNLRLIDPYWGAPYLSRDKCRRIYPGKDKDGNVVDVIYDNGRILQAGYLETTITDVDLKIILREYSFDDLCPFDVATARYGKLPKSFIKLVCGYFHLKTSLKNVKGQEVYYLKSKNKINAIYGMTAQDPVKQTIDFTINPKVDPDHVDFYEREDDPAGLLEKHNQKAFLPYQWGVWTTAWARYRLREGIWLAGHNAVYWDTDSVKSAIKLDFSEYNRQRIKDSKENGAYATDKKGNVHYMGTFEEEHDGEPYYEFCTLGAKKYVYTMEPGGPCEATIAGVAKVPRGKHLSGGQELDKHGGITAFKPGFIFKEAGGTEAIYNDNPDISSVEIDGHTLPITSNVVIRESTYTLGITAEYDELLKISAHQKSLLTSIDE